MRYMLCMCYFLSIQHNFQVNITTLILEIKVKIRKVDCLTQNRVIVSGTTNIQTRISPAEELLLILRLTLVYGFTLIMITSYSLYRLDLLP